MKNIIFTLSGVILFIFYMRTYINLKKELKLTKLGIPNLKQLLNGNVDKMKLKKARKGFAKMYTFLFVWVIIAIILQQY